MPMTPSATSGQIASHPRVVASGFSKRKAAVVRKMAPKVTVHVARAYSSKPSASNDTKIPLRAKTRPPVIMTSMPLTSTPSEAKFCQPTKTVRPTSATSAPSMRQGENATCLVTKVPMSSEDRHRRPEKGGEVGLHRLLGIDHGEVRECDGAQPHNQRYPAATEEGCEERAFQDQGQHRNHEHGRDDGHGGRCRDRTHVAIGIVDEEIAG